jgi:hypothetical protein
MTQMTQMARTFQVLKPSRPRQGYLERANPRALLVLLAAALAALSASEAHAQGSLFQGYFTPFVGPSVGGDTTGARLTAGGSVSVHEESGWGAELDFGYANDTAEGAAGADLGSATVNLIWVSPTRSLRPYLLGGAGWLGLRGCLQACAQAVRANDLGLDAGGGVILLAHDTFGVRGDARYVWAPGDHPNRPNNYGFWRLSVGFTMLWAVLP